MEVAMEQLLSSRYLADTLLERRNVPRYPFAATASWHHAGKFFRGEVLDLSTDGLMLKAPQRIKKSGVIEFHTLGSIPFDLSGQVRWTARQDCSCYMAGVKFIDPTREQRRYLEENYLMDIAPGA